MKLKTRICNYLKKKKKLSYVAACIRSNRLYSAIRYKAWLDDESFIRYQYKKLLGKEIDLENPKDFNEKNNWRKLYDRNPLYTAMADKYAVKRLIDERAGRGHRVPLLGVWNKPQEIDFDALPDRFVLKVNHASGGIVICRDKAALDKKRVIAELNKYQKIDYYAIFREWSYKNIRRRIIAEQYLGENLVDFKNYCFNGKLAYTFVWKNQAKEDGRKPIARFCGAYDRNWKKSEIEIDYPTQDETVDKPQNYDEMVKVAEAMAKDMPFVRVDCYLLNGRVYVGEMTFYPWAGFMKFKDERFDSELGALQQLPLPKKP